MNAPFDFRALETPLAEQPAFPVEAPDGRKDWGEAERQRAFLNRLHMAAPGLRAWANANAGKRNPAKARQEGILSGVFDVAVASGAGMQPRVAFPEFKGYDARGRPGKLRQSQVDWGNAMHRAGHPVACFFDPDSAITWLRGVFPEAFA